VKRAFKPYTLSEQSHKINGDSICQIVEKNQNLTQEEKIYKILGVLKLLSSHKNNVAKVIFDRVCPCPDEFKSS
jgi:metal-dependent hydrolase (beta-lactamase superfamily II)